MRVWYGSLEVRWSSLRLKRWVDAAAEGVHRAVLGSADEVGGYIPNLESLARVEGRGAVLGLSGPQEPTPRELIARL
jgi:hypothetical protein